MVAVPVVEAEVRSAYSSKINWTQVIAVISSILVLFFGPEAGWTASEQASIVVAITVVQGATTMIMRTFFTKTITPSSASRI